MKLFRITDSYSIYFDESNYYIIKCYVNWLSLCNVINKLVIGRFRFTSFLTTTCMHISTDNKSLPTPQTIRPFCVLRTLWGMSSIASAIVNVACAVSWMALLSASPLQQSKVVLESKRTQSRPPQTLLRSQTSSTTEFLITNR